MRDAARILVFLLLACQLVALAHADEFSTETHAGAHGVSAVLSVSEPVAGRHRDASGTPVGDGRRDGTLLWHRHFDDATYTSTGIAGAAEMAFAATYLNPPKQVEATPLPGTGAPDWTWAGTTCYVDASRAGDVLAAVNFNEADSTATIMEFRPDSATPLWSYVVHPCRTLVYQGWASRKPIQVSDDGSTIAVAIVMYTPAGQRGRLFAFDSGSGTPAVDFPFPAGNVVATEISAQGDYIVMAGWPTVYVYDRYGDTLRWSGPIYSGNDALAISGDGRYLAWGWTTFRLTEWNGNGYAPVWTHTPGGGLYVGQCALTDDNGTLAVTWDNGSTYPNEVTVELRALPALELLWSYDYQAALRPAGGPLTGVGGTVLQHVDIPTRMRFSPGGDYLAVGSWGGDFPELHVFERASAEPLYRLDTPGSIFDIDFTAAPAGDLYLTACGKAVHAGQGGRGGDLYAIEISGTTTAVDPAATAPRGTGTMTSFPNPFNPRTTIAYTLERAGPVRLTVHDAQGRLVKKLLEGSLGAGHHTMHWSGTDESGHAVPSGFYALRLQSGSHVESRKLLLAR